MIIQGKFLTNLHAELVETPNNLSKRFPYRKLGSKAPLNIWSGRKFFICHLQVIGSVGYVDIPQQYRYKLQNRSKKGISIDYASRKIGYKIWFPGTTDVQETKHVKIVESSFYNKIQKQEKDMVSFNLNLTAENNSANASTPETSPINWKRVEKVRTKNITEGRIDVYYCPEAGVQCKSKNDVNTYC